MSVKTLEQQTIFNNVIMCVFVCVCMYTCMHVHTYVYMCVCMYACMYIYIKVNRFFGLVYID